MKKKKKITPNKHLLLILDEIKKIAIIKGRLRVVYQNQISKLFGY